MPDPEVKKIIKEQASGQLKVAIEEKPKGGVAQISKIATDLTIEDLNETGVKKMVLSEIAYLRNNNDSLSTEVKYLTEQLDKIKDQCHLVEKENVALKIKVNVLGLHNKLKSTFASVAGVLVGISVTLWDNNPSAARVLLALALVLFLLQFFNIKNGD